MGLANDQIDSDTLQRTIQFEQIAKFDKITEWQKDIWNEGEPLDQGDTQRKFGTDLITYLKCAQIIHGEDSD